jgi:hypothetical protein
MPFPCFLKSNFGCIHAAPAPSELMGVKEREFICIRPNDRAAPINSASSGMVGLAAASQRCTTSNAGTTDLGNAVDPVCACGVVRGYGLWAAPSPSEPPCHSHRPPSSVPALYFILYYIPRYVTRSSTQRPPNWHACLALVSSSSVVAPRSAWFAHYRMCTPMVLLDYSHWVYMRQSYHFQ